MTYLETSLYSKQGLAGACDNPQLFLKKQRLLEAVGLCYRISRVLRIDSVDQLIAFYRVFHFSEADLQICRDFTLIQILDYENPCNLKKTLISVRTYAASRSGLSNLPYLIDSTIGMRFHPEGCDNLMTDGKMGEWCVNSNLIVVRGRYGHSFIARVDINAGNGVMELSKDIPISVLSAFRDATYPGKSLLEQGMHPDAIFLLYLVHMRRNIYTLTCNEHKQFFMTQPTNYGTLFERSNFFLETLHEPDLSQSVKAQNEDLQEISNALQPSYEFSELLWAKSLCASRAFSLCIAPENAFEETLIQKYYPDNKVTTLLPYVHFFNHDFYGQCDIPQLNVEDGSVHVKALVDIKQGEEVFINYGGFSNKQFLLNYGFFVENNPYDRIAYSVGGQTRPAHVDAEIFCADGGLTPDEQILLKGYLADRNRYS